MFQFFPVRSWGRRADIGGRVAPPPACLRILSQGARITRLSGTRKCYFSCPVDMWQADWRVTLTPHCISVGYLTIMVMTSWPCFWTQVLETWSTTVAEQDYTLEMGGTTKYRCAQIDNKVQSSLLKFAQYVIHSKQPSVTFSNLQWCHGIQYVLYLLSTVFWC